MGMRDPKPKGRPSKFTPETVEIIITAVRAGNYMENAADYAGIGTSTLYRWLADAESEDATQELQDFRDALLKAKAEAEYRHVDNIRKAADGGTWQASAWYLERTKPHRWGRQQKVELTGANGGAIEVSARESLLEMLGLADEPTA